MGRTKLSTRDALLEFVSAEFASRRKDVITVFQAKALPDELHARAVILVAYANFEGFLQSTCHGFLEFVASERHSNSSLKPEVLALFLWSNRKPSDPVPADPEIDHLISKYDPLYRVRAPKEVDLESNVTSKVLSRLTRCLCFSNQATYLNYSDFVDAQVLKVRNNIAHGEPIQIAFATAKERAEKLLELMRMFSDDLQNTVAEKSYLRSQSLATGSSKTASAMPL